MFTALSPYPNGFVFKTIPIIITNYSFVLEFLHFLTISKDCMFFPIQTLSKESGAQ